jgi:Rhs element Vgr protein
MPLPFGNAAATALPERSHDLVTFKIWSNDLDLTTNLQVIGISIHRAVNKVAYAVLQVADGDIPGQTMPVSDQDWFLPGQKIKIDLGHHLVEQTVFEGIVVRHEVRVLPNRHPALIIECKDEAVAMTRIRKSNYFYDLTDSDLFSQLIQNYGLDTDIDSTSEQHKSIVQYHCSDWDLMLTRADAQGLLVWTNDGKVFVKKPDFNATPRLTLGYTSQQIIEFEATMDARNSLNGTEAHYWDSANQEIAEETGFEPNGNEQGNVTATTLGNALHDQPQQFYHGGELSTGQVQNWADSTLMRSRLAKIRGRVAIIGWSDISIGDWIAFDGMGNRFNGPAFVSGIRHEVKRGVWTTHLEFGLSPVSYSQQYAADLTDLPASGLTPAIQGLHVGQVTRLEHDDSSSGHLVQVRIPFLGAATDGIWARLALPAAGDGRGLVFYPEIGDEVLVGFLNNDPNYAVVLGALHSLNAVSPVTPTDENPEKGIYCREGMRIVFSDEDKSITLETPGGNKVVLDDNAQSILLEDQRGAKIELNQQGITIDAGSGNITIQGTMINIG